MKIVIIGLGLIGGSIALNLNIKDIILGMDTNQKSLNKAISGGYIDGIATDDDLNDADLVVVTTPVDCILRDLSSILDKIGNQTMVIELGSTKKLICESVANHPKRTNLISAHTIAGSEKSGLDAAKKKLFKNKPVIICEHEKYTALGSLIAVDFFYNRLKMDIYYLTPIEHDEAMAYTSHLPHVLSFVLAELVPENLEHISGTGLESMLRLSHSSPELWDAIFKQNDKNISIAIMETILKLTEFYAKINQLPLRI